MQSESGKTSANESGEKEVESVRKPFNTIIILVLCGLLLILFMANIGFDLYQISHGDDSKIISGCKRLIYHVINEIETPPLIT